MGPYTGGTVDIVPADGAPGRFNRASGFSEHYGVYFFHLNLNGKETLWTFVISIWYPTGFVALAFLWFLAKEMSYRKVLRNVN